MGEMRKGPLAIEEISNFPALNVTSAVRRSLSTTRAAASGAETDSGSTNGERANCGGGGLGRLCDDGGREERTYLDRGDGRDVAVWLCFICDPGYCLNVPLESRLTAVETQSFMFTDPFQVRVIRTRCDRVAEILGKRTGKPRVKQFKQI